MNRFDGIIFDMDGVLIDVSRSYDKVIEKTVNYFSKEEKLISHITQKDIDIIKSIPGFNNDWDCAYGLLEAMRENRDIFETKPILQKNRTSKDYKKIKDVFQTYYLGNILFQKCYKKLPPISNKIGLINNESILLHSGILQQLKDKYVLGVATSRPRFEALFTLKKFKISPEFIQEKYIIAQENARYEKPNPAPLLEATRRMEIKNAIYVGDNVSDVIAAKRANMQCIYIGNKKLGNFQLTNINRLKEVISI